MMEVNGTKQINLPFTRLT